MPFRSPRSSRVGAAATALAAVAIVVSVVGCTNQTTPSPHTSSPSAVPSPSATPSTFGPDASTPVALTFFDSTVLTLLKTDPKPHGRDVIDALAKAGFDKKAMELTPDATTIGRDVDSIEFSVLWKKKDCLVGQVGSAGYGSSSSPVLSTGKCLVGTTRTIDW